MSILRGGKWIQDNKDSAAVSAASARWWAVFRDGGDPVPSTDSCSHAVCSVGHYRMRLEDVMDWGAMLLQTQQQFDRTGSALVKNSAGLLLLFGHRLEI